jgi:ABC-type multidrug transport system permease subunit
MLTLASATTTGIFTVFLIIIASSLSGEAFSDRWWLIIIDVLVLAVTVAMTIVALSNFRIKPEAASGITNLVSLSFCFLGGIFVPLEYIGNTAKAIGQFLPTYWYSEAMQRIKNGSGFGDIVNCLLIQLMFGIMILVIGLLVGKHNVKKAE